MKANYPLLAAAALMLASCVAPTKPAPPPPPPPAPAPVVVAPPPPPLLKLPADWRDAAQTPGDWRYTQMKQREIRGTPFPAITQATFSSSRTEDLFAITCERDTKQVQLGFKGMEADNSFITITTTAMARTLSAPASEDSWNSVSLSPRDPILDAMAFSRGRFIIEVPGMGALYLPAWAELSRVIEDCR